MKDAAQLLEAAARIAGANRKDWVRLADLRAAFEGLADVPAGTVHGLDAPAWFDTARRYHAGLRTIAYTNGAGIDHQWARDQARWYLGDGEGLKAWAMPDAPELWHIVIPRDVPPAEAKPNADA